MSVNIQVFLLIVSIIIKSGINNIAPHLLHVLVVRDVYGVRKHLHVFMRPSLRRDVLWYTNVRLSACPSVRPSVCPSIRPFHMSRSNLRTPWPIHFKFHRVIGIDGLTVCVLYGEISNFHSRVMGLYSSNSRRFFVCRAVN